MEEKSAPLDLGKMKEMVRQESTKLNLRSFSTEGESAFTLALALIAAIKKIFYEKSGTTFSAEPIMEKKVVTQFVHRMRVDAMEKFNATTVFSTVQFASNEEGLKKNEYVVSVIVYLEQKYLPEFLRLLQYPYIDSESLVEVKDGCGTIVNLISGQFKKEMAKLGYKDCMMSHFESYINTVVDGVAIPHGSTEKFEISFEVEGAKRLVVELATLSILPKWEVKEQKTAKKILVIDDDPTFVKTIAAFLQSHGFQVIAAFDGKEGLIQLKENPELIILDLQMPNMNGYEFILAMKKSNVKQVPIFIITVEKGLEDIVNVEGIKEYMVKPFKPDLLLSSIQRYV